MLQAGTFKLLGQKFINIIIHKQDVVKVAPIKRGRGSIIHLRNKVLYTVSESQQEVHEKLNLLTA
ncbi:MAG TPA: hypothetical protein VGN64_20120 [Dyadobacter sp.]|jgi:hypothetical protein|nr:hypothetical protein [Dyadobacter sp.]